MKKRMIVVPGMILCLIMALILAAEPVKGLDAEWTLVGQAGFTAGFASNIAMALNQSGYPCVFYADNSNGNKASVMQWSGTDWEQVGAAGFSAGSVANATNSLTLVFDSLNTPYVAYRDTSQSNKATVMKFDGSDWVTVGSAGFTADAVQYLFLAIDDQDTLHVAFLDEANSNKATVMKFDGSAWILVGSPGFSDGAAAFPTLDFDSSHRPYVAYQDIANGNGTTVQRYTETDGWQVLGSKAFSPGQVNFPIIRLNQLDVPYIAFADLFNSYEASVMTYNGTAWEMVGDPGFSAGVSFSMPWYMALQFDQSNVPYIAYAAQRVYVFYYGSSWQQLGTLPLTDYYCDYTAMAVAANGTVYVAFSDGDSTSGANGKATVMSYMAGSDVTITPTPTDAAPTPTATPTSTPTPTDTAPTPTPVDQEPVPQTGTTSAATWTLIGLFAICVMALFLSSKRSSRN